MRTEFDELKKHYNTQVDDLRKKLDEENKRREANQISSINTEMQTIEASKENFELKAEIFQREIEKTKLENKKEQADQNIKLLTEKKKQLDKQLQMAQTAEDTQTRKVEGELNKINLQLERSKQECESAEAHLNDLQTKNEASMHDNDWENKIKALKDTLFSKEQEGIKTQAHAD